MAKLPGVNRSWEVQVRCWEGLIKVEIGRGATLLDKTAMSSISSPGIP